MTLRSTARLFKFMVAVFLVMVLAVATSFWFLPKVAQGPAGPPGVQGVAGPTGDAGAKGSKGAKGDDGDAGAQGKKGTGFWGASK